MKAIVTGGAGFIGRWVVKNLLDRGADVFIFDNLSNGRKENLAEFNKNKHFKGLFIGDIRNTQAVKKMFSIKPDICIHLAAAIDVQQSIDHPEYAIEVNVNGTFHIMEEARKYGIKVVLVGTCMVYDTSASKPINEEHPLNPLSPYAGSKIAAESIALSYFHAYGLPVTVVRPFNTYGPFQKTSMEGGVVSVFIAKKLGSQNLNIYGTGKQTRDLLYAEDCAEFIVKAALSDKANGHVINAGTGKDISINELAALICPDKSCIVHVPHHHQQAEIMKLVCDFRKAKKMLGWMPKTTLKKGIMKTEAWIKTQQ